MMQPSLSILAQPQREAHHLSPKWVSSAFAGVNLPNGCGFALDRDKVFGRPMQQIGMLAATGLVHIVVCPSSP